MLEPDIYIFFKYHLFSLRTSDIWILNKNQNQFPASVLGAERIYAWHRGGLRVSQLCTPPQPFKTSSVHHSFHTLFPKPFNGGLLLSRALFPMSMAGGCRSSASHPNTKRRPQASCTLESAELQQRLSSIYPSHPRSLEYFKWWLLLGLPRCPLGSPTLASPTGTATGGLPSPAQGESGRRQALGFRTVMGKLSTQGSTMLSLCVPLWACARCFADFRAAMWSLPGWPRVIVFISTL